MKTILSIDGGGVRGIIPLACLVRLEAKEGKPSREIFDMVAGTSTGAVIAAGIAVGISARGLLALYRELAAKAFRQLPWWKILFNGGNHRYSNEFIDQTLTQVGADAPLNSLPIDVMITGKNTQTGRTDFFVRDNPGNAEHWGTMSLKDAVLASIAAPTYFPAHSAQVMGEEYTWVDGGVGVAGNPCYQAAVEALYYTNGEFEPGDVRMVSFGTGRAPHPIDPQRANAIAWASWVLSELLEDSADWQTYVTRREYGMSDRLDFRRYQLDLAPDVMSYLGVEVPPGTDLASIGLDAVWAIDFLESIGRAFAARIDFDDPNGLELDTGKV
ncbi:MAG TPA: patatin-like phospholipase family protein [Anaerolineales bacterium]|nr:patatin-like phospholipase family protein [Anaerolineales bacterium]